jgi:hypothetical protein
MKRNVGGNDRIARLVLGPVLVVAALVLYFQVLTVTGLLGAGLIVAGLLVGAVLLVTGAVGYCPLNRVLGIDTFRADTTDETDELPPESEIGRAS